MRAICKLVLIASIATTSAEALPPKLDRYRVLTGVIDIPFGSYVEGSHRFGGMQPDYVLRAKDPGLKEVLRFARATRELNLAYWQRVSAVLEYISSRALPRGDYHDPAYRAVSRAHLERGTDVPVGKYITCQAGVCRENALVTHFALKEAGIENFHVYARVEQGRGFSKQAEDHAFLVVQHGGEYWTIDSYNSNFNGFRLSDLLSEQGISNFVEGAPISQPNRTFRRVVRINNYPRVFVPAGAKASVLNQHELRASSPSLPCEKLFSRFIVPPDL